MADFVGTKHDEGKGDKKKKSKKPVTSSSEDSGPDDVTPVPHKKAKVEEQKPKKGESKKTGADEEASFELSKHKYVKVRTFRNQVLIDIRQFYLAPDGELKPGKGISLTPVQWEQLKAVITDVDAAIVERI